MCEEEILTYYPHKKSLQVIYVGYLFNSSQFPKVAIKPGCTESLHVPVAVHTLYDLILPTSLNK